MITVIVIIIYHTLIIIVIINYISFLSTLLFYVYLPKESTFILVRRWSLTKIIRFWLFIIFIWGWDRLILFFMNDIRYFSDTFIWEQLLLNYICESLLASLIQAINLSEVFSNIFRHLVFTDLKFHFPKLLIELIKTYYPCLTKISITMITEESSTVAACFWEGCFSLL